MAWVAEGINQHAEQQQTSCGLQIKFTRFSFYWLDTWSVSMPKVRRVEQKQTHSLITAKKTKVTFKFHKFLLWDTKLFAILRVSRPKIETFIQTNDEHNKVDFSVFNSFFLERIVNLLAPSMCSKLKNERTEKTKT